VVSRVTALIFAKYPEPGSVNTRMVPPLTPAEAAALHGASLLAVCERVAGVGRVDAKLVVTPDERADVLLRVVADYVAECWPQGNGALGRRLTRATDRALENSASGVLLLGADSPTLPMSYVTDAVAALDKYDAVLGPCDDGGYYLLGMRRRLPALFDRIDWGGPDVADQTRDRAAAIGANLSELPTWYDLDRCADLQRAARDLMDETNLTEPASIALHDIILAYLERYPHG
jgi:hypothetical protein